MLTLIVLSVELPEPEDVVDVIHHLDPPTIPHFAGQVRVVVDEDARATLAWLDG